MHSNLSPYVVRLIAAKAGALNTSGASTSGTATVAGTGQQQQQQATIIETSGQPQTTQHVVTQQENADGTQSLQIAHVQSLQGHQLTIGNLNQVLLKKE